MGLVTLGFVETLFLFFLPSSLADDEATGFFSGFLNLDKSIFSEDIIVGPSSFLAFARMMEAFSLILSSDGELITFSLEDSFDCS